MSDVFEGPGWWMASDGKWYEPARHPDPAYRDRFIAPTLEPTEPTPPTTAASLDDQGSAELTTPPESSGFPSVASAEPAVGQEPRAATYADLSRAIDPNADLKGQQAFAQADPSISNHTVAPPPQHTPSFEGTTPQIPEVRVGRTVISDQGERPTFDMAPPASVRTGNGISLRGDVELEVGRDKHEVRQIATEAMSKPFGRKTTAIERVEGDQEDEVTTREKVIAAVLFFSGVAMIVGSFLDWTGGQIEQTGWDRGDGIITVLVGVVGSAAAGPIYVGFRHMVPKLTAMICGAIGFAVAALVWITTASDTGPGSVTAGAGLIVAGVASLAMALAGLADRGEELY